MALNTEAGQYLVPTDIDQRPEQLQTLGERQLKVLERTLALQEVTGDWAGSTTLRLCGLG